ncbi:MAG: hypothetical protein UR26_C0006G0029 [candidate division TM6 bacterium GW2011_GWF2_32_72]|nr:MAG: hypothetical protein UR26_C0006G0029 [candidate division TM6 bacterium GW2011_GWF2_32_72]
MKKLTILSIMMLALGSVAVEGVTSKGVMPKNLTAAGQIDWNMTYSNIDEKELTNIKDNLLIPLKEAIGKFKTDAVKKKYNEKLNNWDKLKPEQKRELLGGLLAKAHIEKLIVFDASTLNAAQKDPGFFAKKMKNLWIWAKENKWKTGVVLVVSGATVGAAGIAYKMAPKKVKGTTPAEEDVVEAKDAAVESEVKDVLEGVPTEVEKQSTTQPAAQTKELAADVQSVTPTTEETKQPETKPEETKDTGVTPDMF